MQHPLTTYTVTGTNTSIVWQFKYHLSGLLAEFKLIEGELDQKQVRWLFILGNFPYQEKQIKGWVAIKNFKIEVGLPDLSFESFWNAYNLKSKKTRAQQLYDKLTDADKVLAINHIKRYDNWLRQQKGMAKALPDTYIYQKRWLDEL